ncbi:MAG TPA: FHA domain-containing protein, partial [Thermoleophilaceae bacterium]|nr:FHA domain-containing protein [Thermoleophilaceae bacterium]
MPATLRLHRDGQPPLELQGERALVGRDKGCDVAIDDTSVSRRHVALERRGEDWFVVDQGSANGSFVDGKRVGEAPLRDGQRLRLGSVELRVEIELDVPE